MNAVTIDLWIKGAGAFFGAGAAVFAAATYQRNARTKAAEFLLSLHKSFFVDKTYERMKVLLDCDDPIAEFQLNDVVRTEPMEFTDFLNFFELVAYLTSISTLSGEDCDALVGYYLDKLIQKPSVRAYIRASSHGFEHLRRLLVEREALTTARG